METYSDMRLRFQSKVKRYDVAMCDFALEDCRDSLQRCIADSQAHYRMEKTSEMEIINERKAALTKLKTRSVKKAANNVQSQFSHHRVERVDFSSHW